MKSWSPRASVRGWSPCRPGTSSSIRRRSTATACCRRTSRRGVAIEQASTFGWERYIGPSGRVIGMKTFGASAPLKELQRKVRFRAGPRGRGCKGTCWARDQSPWLPSWQQPDLRIDRLLAHPVAAANRVGRSSPSGSTVYPGGVNFSVYSRDASAVDLLLFDREDDHRPSASDSDRSRDQPHLPLLARVRPGRDSRARSTAIALHGPFDPASGMRFDPAKVLLDPYGRGVVVPKNYSRDAARSNQATTRPRR